VTAHAVRGVACLASLACSGAATAATPAAELPVVRAHSRSVDVEDAGRLQRGIWTISPDTGLDVYEARRASGDRKVTFRTDLDSISFDVQPGGQYDFEVLLDGRRCCHTRISARLEVPRGADSIPFTIGANDKIHVLGRINGSQPLNLEVDLGADTLVLFPSGLRKDAAARIDGRADNFGAGGVVRSAFSIDNRLSVGNLEWQHERAILVDKQSDSADGIIGYPQLDHKVIEFDYDANVLRVSDELPARAAAWTKLPLTFIGHLPAISARLDTGHGAFEVPLVLDTGSNLSLFVNREYTERYLSKLSLLPRLGTSEMRGTGNGTVPARVLRLPALRLGAEELRDLPMHAEDGAGPSGLSGHLGMDVLRRFNMVLDLRNDTVYLAPNHGASQPYRTNYRTGLIWKVLPVAAALAVLAIWYFVRRRRIEPPPPAPIREPAD
jgi:hypothetical protein